MLYNETIQLKQNYSFFGRALVQSFRVNEAVFVQLGRAVRYNLCCVSLHRGFSLPSLTQKQKTRGVSRTGEAF